MIGRTHDLAAFTALGLVVATEPLPKISLATAMVALFANMIGGIAPDIDQPTAPFWKNLPIGKYAGRTFDRLLGGHRFLSHSLIGLIIFGLGWHYLLIILMPSFPYINMDIVWWAFMIGFLSHLVMDSFTREGVPWLLPIPFKFGIPPLTTLRVSTGGLIEKFIIFPSLILLNIFIYKVYYVKLLTFLHQYIK